MECQADFFAQSFESCSSSKDLTAARLGKWVSEVNDGDHQMFQLSTSSMEGFLWSVAVSLETNPALLKELSHFGVIHLTFSKVMEHYRLGNLPQIYVERYHNDRDEQDYFRGVLDASNYVYAHWMWSISEKPRLWMQLLGNKSEVWGDIVEASLGICCLFESHRLQLLNVWGEANLFRIQYALSDSISKFLEGLDAKTITPIPGLFSPRPKESVPRTQDSPGILQIMIKLRTEVVVDQDMWLQQNEQLKSLVQGASTKRGTGPLTSEPGSDSELVDVRLDSEDEPMFDPDPGLKRKRPLQISCPATNLLIEDCDCRCCIEKRSVSTENSPWVKPRSCCRRCHRTSMWSVLLRSTGL